MDEQRLSGEEYDWLWLCCIPDFSENDRKQLLRVFGTPGNLRRAVRDREKELAAFTGKKQAALAAHQKEFSEREAWKKYQSMGIRFVSCGMPQYPESLRGLPDYPSGLFYKGKLPGKDGPCAALVGARVCSGYGRSMAKKLAYALAKAGVCVVSGMAYGIDAFSQEACLEAGGTSFGVLGCGVDICYPSENRALYGKLMENGGVLSEYPPGTRPMPYRFPARNRIISGLSRLVVVVEARKKSGTLITADLALEQGRDVYAVPGRLGDALSEGCNRLIAQGAGILTDIDAFLAENGWDSNKGQNPKKNKLALATPEKLLYSCLDSGPRGLQELQEASGLSAKTVMEALFGLQMKNLIEETAKNHYIKL